MCHHYRIVEEEALFEAADEREEEPEPELTAEEEERERPILTADD